MNTAALNIALQKIQHPSFAEHHVDVSVLRLDALHPVVSGNKLFKLYYFLEQAKKQPKKPVLTFGGAYSNHLVATAYACQAISIRSIGVVRGERPKILSPTLMQCQHYGMELLFVSREIYKQKSEPTFFDQMKINATEYTIIPEGGYHPLGAKGAALIMDTFEKQAYTHICSAVGTATTFAGLLLNKTEAQEVIGFSVLKNMTDIPERIHFLTEKSADLFSYKIISDYHEGGYARKTNQLINFINLLWKSYELPTDFVYTAKMIYGAFDLIEKKYFPPESKILLIHTGGLQGNASLPKNTLLF